MDSKQSPYPPPNAYPPPGPPQQGYAQQGYPPYEQSYAQQGYPPQQPRGYPQHETSYTSVPQMQPQQGGSEKHPGQLPLQPTTFQHGKFRNRFCSCCDNMGLCCLGCWCPCIVYAKTRARFNNPRLSKEQLPCCSGACCGFATVLMFCPPFQCIFGWMQRGDIRAKYDIEGNGCVDCLAHTFCDCCVWFLSFWRGADVRRWFRRIRRFRLGRMLPYLGV